MISLRAPHVAQRLSPLTQLIPHFSVGLPLCISVYDGWYVAFCAYLCFCFLSVLTKCPDLITNSVVFIRFGLSFRSLCAFLWLPGHLLSAVFTPSTPLFENTILFRHATASKLASADLINVPKSGLQAVVPCIGG